MESVSIRSLEFYSIFIWLSVVRYFDFFGEGIINKDHNTREYSIVK
jgi:hypothetical protein